MKRDTLEVRLESCNINPTHLMHAQRQKTAYVGASNASRLFLAYISFTHTRQLMVFGRVLFSGLPSYRVRIPGIHY